MPLFDNDHNPAMRYEGLARAAFDDCNKYGDPFNYAAQDRYDAFFCPEPTEMGKRALSTIITKLVNDHQDHDSVQHLKDLDDVVWQASSQEDIVNIIDRGNELVSEIRGF